MLHAGVIDQDIDRNAISLQRINCLFDGVRVSHVEHAGQYFGVGG